MNPIKFDEVIVGQIYCYESGYKIEKGGLNSDPLYDNPDLFWNLAFKHELFVNEQFLVLEKNAKRKSIKIIILGKELVGWLESCSDEEFFIEKV